MEIIKSKIIHNKEAKLILEDNGTATIIYDGITLLKDINWANLVDDTDIHETLLIAEVENYLDKHSI